MMNKAKKLVKDYYNSHVDVTDNVILTENDVYIVWFSKTLQNWKALVSTNVSDGMYYEVTYNGDSKETYLDVYKKEGTISTPVRLIIKKGGYLWLGPLGFEKT